MRRRIATLALILSGNDVLLGRKRNEEIGNGYWNGPGGKKRRDERKRHCLVRETWDEVRVRLFPEYLEHVAYIESFADGIFFQEFHIYATRVFEGMPRETEYMETPAWFPADTLPFGQMHEGDRHFWPQALRAADDPASKFSGKIWYERPGAGFIDFQHFPY